jgi:hypothetical protein
VATDPITAGLELSRQLLADIDALIKKSILNTVLDIIPGIDSVARAIETELAKSEQVIFTAEQAIKAQIIPAITNAVPDAIALAASLASSLDTHLTQLLSNIATTEDVLGTAIATAKTHAPDLANWLYTNFAGQFGNVALGVLKEMEQQDSAGVNALLDHILGLPNAPSWFTELTQGFRNRGAEWQALALPAILVGALIGIVEAIQEPFQTAIRQDAYSLMPTKEAPEQSVIAALIKGAIHAPEFDRRLKNLGYREDVQSLMLQSAYDRLPPEVAARIAWRNLSAELDPLSELRQRGLDGWRAQAYLDSLRPLLNEDDLRNAWLRGAITDLELATQLGGYGFTPEQIKLRQTLYFYIPPVPDVIHMGIRNVFNPEIVQRFTLDGDYPQAFEDAARQQGVSSAWAHKYWQAHWIMPGREAFFEMFQRTTDQPLDDNADTIELEDGTHVYNIIGRDTLNLALRDIDTPPFYRDKLTQVAYRTLTRIDIRRLHKVGLLSKAQVERAYLDLGNTPEHSRLLAEFVVRLNATTTKSQSQALTTNLQRHVIQLYIQDKLSIDQVKSTLADLGFSDDEVAIYTEEAKLVRAVEYSTAVETGVGRLYQTGRIVDTDAIQRLRDAGLPDDAIHTLMAKWELAIEYRELPAHVVTHRELTASEVLESLVDGIIDEPTAEGMLENVGYDKDSSDTRIGLAKYKATRATRRVQIDAIKAAYTNGVIEQLEASNRLDALYISAEQRDAYLTEWSLSRETRTERIPIATLRDMFKGQYLDEPTTIQHLKRHRFTDDDALLLVKFWANQPAPKRLVNVSGA